MNAKVFVLIKRKPSPHKRGIVHLGTSWSKTPQLPEEQFNCTLAIVESLSTISPRGITVRTNCSMILPVRQFGELVRDAPFDRVYDHQTSPQC